MWRATTDEEANCIFDLLADRDDSAAVVRYAQWLDRHDALRAEFLRLDLAPWATEARLDELRQQLDPRWLAMVTKRRFRVGDHVRILGGVLAGIEGAVREVDARQGRAGLLLHMFYCPRELTWVPFTDLRVVQRASEAESPGYPA